METDDKGLKPHPAPGLEDREGKPVKPEQEQPEVPEDLPEAYRKLETERREIYDRLLRKQAELDNTRKRIEREKDEFLQHANSGLLLSLLPTLDGFDRALKHRDPKVPEQFYQGMELIYRQLLETLQRAGLSAVETKGLIFDPEIHQAVETVQSPKHRHHEIVEELQRGYRLKRRLLRPALVKVAVQPEKDDAADSEAD